ncbi:MAG: hypothetical protein ACM37V_16010 [Gemmatimonadota bacterium]
MSSEQIMNRETVDGVTNTECPDGLHTWRLVREYRGRDYFSITAIEVQPDGVRVTADGAVARDEIIEVHSERLVCRDCRAERGGVTTVEYRL